VLLSDRCKEKLQDLVDDECASAGRIDMWPEHWEAAGALIVWRCSNCGRFYLNPLGDPGQVEVYALEGRGIRPVAPVRVTRRSGDADG
jgi:hypothetical protein